MGSLDAADEVGLGRIDDVEQVGELLLELGDHALEATRVRRVRRRSVLW